MHCAFLLPIMKRHGLAHLLDSSDAGTQFRRLLLDTVLATDMGVHAQFMQRFTHLMEKPSEFTNVEARTLLCQALIKCADISNPVRPYYFRSASCRSRALNFYILVQQQPFYHVIIEPTAYSLTALVRSACVGMGEPSITRATIRFARVCARVR